MTNNEKSNGFLTNVDITNSIDNAVKNLTDKPTINIGQTFADCWFLVFGGISQKARLREIKYGYNLKIFKNILDDKISNIPAEYLTEPITQIVMQALENSKYCVEESELREMFANLISSSIDNRKSTLIHPSFGELLKSMSPLDAQNLLLFGSKNYLPFCHVRVREPNSPNYRYEIPYLFLMNSECDDTEKLAQSISSLIRLGLISTPYNSVLNDKEAYFIYDNSSQYKNIKLKYPDLIVELEKGLLELTPMGSSFLKVCCN